MRRSREVPLTLLAAVALSTLACNRQPEMKSCVDAQGRILPDESCQAQPAGRPVGGHYVFGGSSGGRVGDTVVGGRSSPGEEGVSRGGFGGEGEGGHGGGEGGGHGGGGGE